MKTFLVVATLTVLTVLGSACRKGGAASDSGPTSTPVTDNGKSIFKAEMPSKTPEDWIVIQDDYIPVIDDLSRTMQSARQAFVLKDPAKAAIDIRAAADLLSKERVDASLGEQESLDVAMKAMSALGTDLDSRKSIAADRFDAAIALAHRADLSRNWIVLDEKTWYPYIEEPDRHFQNAHRAFVAKDFTTAAEEIRKGEAFVRLEAGRAAGEVRNSLDASAQELVNLAARTQKGTVQDLAEVDTAFKLADAILARSHQIKASANWTQKETVKAGYEMKACALFLEEAAEWAGSEAKARVSAVVSQTRILAGKLTQDGGYAADEVDKSIDDLDKAIFALGNKALPG